MKQTTEDTEHTVIEFCSPSPCHVSRHRPPSSPLPCAPCLPWFLLVCFAVASSAAEFRVGFASADITPPVGWRRAGNYTELISTGVNDPLMTKAMVVQDGATTFEIGRAS